MQSAPRDQLDIFASPSTELEAKNFRLMGDRRLAPTWRQRAADCVIAIRTMQDILSSNRPATDAEKAKLIKFTGFGATDLANAIFGGKPGEYRSGFEAIGKSLDKMLSPADFAALSRATQYAHYTPEYIIRAMWRAVHQLGFTGGAILEPGVGSGLFIALMPEAIGARSSVLGIERDPVTARITRLLYPESDIQEADFTKVKLPPGFDLAIGNPPFARRTIHTDDEVGKLGFSLHDYFIARSIERLRPGGLAAFVVSRYTMDKGDTSARRYIAGMADLVGAIRLPEAAMRADAGTDVVVDILFFQKRAETIYVEHDPKWVETAQCGLEIDGKPVWVNAHFIDNPSAVLGTHAVTSSQFGPVYTCKRSGADLDVLLSAALATLPANIYQVDTIDRRPAPVQPTGPRVQVGTASYGARIKEGSYFVDETEKKDRQAELYEQADRASGAERKALLRQAAKVMSEPGKLYQIVDGQARLIEVKSGRGTSGIFPSHAAIICDLIPVKEAVRDVLRCQEADVSWHDEQRTLNQAYDAFVAKHGPINLTVITEVVDKVTGETKERFRYPNLAPFRDDPDCYLVASIEHYDQDHNVATKGPIFSQRILMPPPEVTITSGADALAVSLNELGRVDISRVAELLGKSEQDAIADLGDTVYLNPTTSEWEMADAYLSGKVRDKLAAARDAAANEPRFRRNVEALEACQPIDLLPSDITVRLGTPWLPTDVIEAFCVEVIGIKVAIYHTPEVGVWSVPVASFQGLAAATTDWGTERRHAGFLLLDALSGNVPEVWDHWRDADGTERRALNPKETQAAKDKLAAIQEAFAGWVWKNADRSDRLCGIYNREWNNLVTRTFNGDHLLLPGASDVIKLRHHQKRGTWRMIVAGSTYLAHTVGAGKTFCMIAAVMEQRRLGLVSKPMIAVPGHTLSQWACEFLMLYPNAKILVADEENFAKEKRLRFVARAALGDWDAIIITHSAFKMISVPRDFEERMIEDQIDTYDSARQHVDDGDRQSIKAIEAQKEKLKDRMEALKSRKDDMLTLSEMGVDQIYYDEAQQARKLSFATNTNNLKGVDPNGSQTAWDLYVKSKFLAQKRPDRALNLASGTPITNTMGEMYTLLRFMNEGALVERNIQFFDAWAGAFGQQKTELELQPSGLYKPVTRFSTFVNIPELTSMFREVADVVLAEDLRNYVSLPTIRGGQRKVLTYDAGATFKQYQKLLAARIKVIEDRGGKPQKGDDIILSIIGDGRHAAIDMRFVNVMAGLARISPDCREATRVSGFKAAAYAAGKEWGIDAVTLLEQAPVANYENKLNGLIDTAFSIWRKTSDYRYRDPATGDFYSLPGAAQMIFSDLGTEAAAENRGFSAYTEIVERLVKLGVPRHQIAIMQHFKKAAAKQRLFGDVNAGRVRFLLGSSQTMGTGVNAQLRLVALHHLDVPWLPSDVEQREGRIIRQGNQNAEVQTYAYATLGSMDATMWQTVERKARFIDAVLRGDKSVRTLEDLEADQASQFALAKALASGDDRLKRKAGLEADIARLQRKRSAHYDAQSNVRRQLNWANENITRAQATARSLESDIAVRSIPTKEDFSMVVDGKTYADQEKAGEALMKALNTAALAGRERRWIIGSFAGFQLEADTWLGIAKGKQSARITLSIVRSAVRTVVFDQDIQQGVYLIKRMIVALDSLDEQLAEANQTIARNESVIADYGKRISDAPFDLQAELDNLIEELRQVDLDLAKA